MPLTIKQNMRTPLLVFGCLITIAWAHSDEVKTEADYLSLLHTLQYKERPEDLAKRIPNFPEPKLEAGGNDNTEIEIQTKLFGFDAVGEFNFHKGILVSHGFRILTPTYKDAHGVFLKCAEILDSQVDGLKLSAALPFALDGEDSTDGPVDEINLYLEGVKDKADFQLALAMRAESMVVQWGAQQVSPREE
jgi:hypothetical protein